MTFSVPYWLLQLLETLSIKTQGSAEQCVQNDSQGSHIYQGSTLHLALEEIWGRIKKTATGLQLVTKGEFLVEDKIFSLDVYVSTQEQIFCLYVSMTKNCSGQYSTVDYTVEFGSGLFFFPIVTSHWFSNTAPSLSYSKTRQSVSSVSITSINFTMLEWFRAFIILTS